MGKEFDPREACIALGIDPDEYGFTEPEEELEPIGVVTTPTILNTKEILTQMVVMRATGMTHQAIADRIGCHVNSIKRHINSPEAQEISKQFSADMLAQAKERINTLGLKSVQVIEEALNSKNEKIRVNTALKILDKIGIKDIEIPDVVGATTGGQGMTKDALAEIVKTAYTKGATDVQYTEGGGD